MGLVRFCCYHIVLPLTLTAGIYLPSACSFADSPLKQRIQLPPLSLQDALVSVSRQTGVTLYADDVLLQNKDTPAVDGTFTVDTLLTHLLQGSQLSFQRQGDDLYIILPQSKAPATTEQPSSTRTQITKPLMEDIVVTGARIWDRDSGFARKRQWVGANAFLSKDVITQTPGLSVADIIGTLPGVMAFSDMRLGQAATSEAEYLSVRNMGSEYTSTFIDGMPVESADMSTRSLSENAGAGEHRFGQGFENAGGTMAGNRDRRRA